MKVLSSDNPSLNRELTPVVLLLATTGYFLASCQDKPQEVRCAALALTISSRTLNQQMLREHCRFASEKHRQLLPHAVGSGEIHTLLSLADLTKVSASPPTGLIQFTQLAQSNRVWNLSTPVGGEKWYEIRTNPPWHSDRYDGRSTQGCEVFGQLAPISPTLEPHL